jgi:hypothetical protein
MAASYVTLSYDSVANIIHMSFPRPLELRTKDEISAHFERVIAFWRANAGGKKAYFVVNFDNVTIDAAELAHYTAQSKRAHDVCAIASFRYGGSALQRTATRLAGMKMQRPSNIFDTREEAMAAVRAMKVAEHDAPPAPEK